MRTSICDELGIDTISAGGTLAFAMECGERGLLDGGPRFGEPEALLGWIDRVGRREGLGDRLAEPVEQHTAIGEPGQLVAVRQTPSPCFQSRETRQLQREPRHLSREARRLLTRSFGLPSAGGQRTAKLRRFGEHDVQPACGIRRRSVAPGS